MRQLEVRDFKQWREVARPLLTAGTPPVEIVWSDWRTPSLSGLSRESPSEVGAAGILSVDHPSPRGAPFTAPPFEPQVPPAISRQMLSLLADLACYRHAGRWEFMYRLTWRVLHENRALLENAADPDVRRARLWAKAVHRDIHKMHAFVRFHETDTAGERRYVAWFEPEHEILRRTAPFFAKRFPNMRWMIATPDGAVVWAGERTDFIAAPARSCIPREDATHSLWRAYYRNICNAARINPAAMQKEMPRRYWRHLPEASEINSLLREGNAATFRAIQTPPTADDLRVPRAIARRLETIAPPADSPLTCRLCELWRHATQAVPGEGPEDASIMLVGEQPGDEEDLRGRPFVGPAGRVLDDALRSAQLNRAELFVTNAVKHFKWEPRGKRRLHKRPDSQEIRACGTWLEREIARVSPKVIVALGSTAIRAVTGRAVNVEAARQEAQRHPRGAQILCTYHPSAILRSEGERKAQLIEALQSDLRRAATLVS